MIYLWLCKWEKVHYICNKNFYGKGVQIVIIKTNIDFIDRLSYDKGINVIYKFLEFL